MFSVFLFLRVFFLGFFFRVFGECFIRVLGVVEKVGFFVISNYLDNIGIIFFFGFC